jgi:hypothetical protein
MAVDRDPEPFIERLRNGTLAVPVHVVGMVQTDGEKSDSIQLSKDCSTWISIPASMIEEISLLGAQKCKDHKHEVAGIHLKEPQTEEGAVYARLITEQVATPSSSWPPARSVNDKYVPVPGGCASCYRDAYRACGNYDYECVKDFLRNVCPECSG